MKELYNTHYNPKDAVQEEEVDEDLDYFDKEMDEQFNPKVSDQWKHYTTQEGRTATRPVNVFHWWRDNGKHLPAVQQMAYDLLAIPAMSSEVERAFSGARNTMDDHRTRLGAAIFEMTELEKQWMRAGLGDDLGPSGDLAGYLTPDGKAVLEKVLWGKEGRPKDLDEDVEPV
jgi:hAT family C-terminal dimerisation region